MERKILFVISKVIRQMSKSFFSRFQKIQSDKVVFLLALPVLSTVFTHEIFFNIKCNQKAIAAVTVGAAAAAGHMKDVINMCVCVRLSLCMSSITHENSQSVRQAGRATMVMTCSASKNHIKKALKIHYETASQMCIERVRVELAIFN